jgi:hypothetical protein
MVEFDPTALEIVTAGVEASDSAAQRLERSDLAEPVEERMTPLRLGIVGLTLATALIHLVLAIPLTIVPFYLNALGYIALLTAFLLPSLMAYRRPIRWLLMGYTSLTILLWVVFGQPYIAIGYIDKALELGLLGLLWLDQQQAAR